MSCTYLAHHELESVVSLFGIVIICSAADDKEHTDGHWPAWQSVAAAGLCLHAGHTLYIACLIECCRIRMVFQPIELVHWSKP